MINKNTLTALFLKIDPSPIFCFQYTLYVFVKTRQKYNPVKYHSPKYEL